MLFPETDRLDEQLQFQGCMSKGLLMEAIHFSYTRPNIETEAILDTLGPEISIYVVVRARKTTKRRAICEKITKTGGA